MLKMSQPTVGRYLREYEQANKTVLPRRGTIHDMGPTLTHKEIIIEKLFIEQNTVQQTAYHQFQANSSLLSQRHES